VSEGGIRLDVGALGAVPEIFGVAFSSDGKVIRLCQIAWRRRERIDARFLTARQLRRTAVAHLVQVKRPVSLPG
jgi:hypothetical protein